MDLLSQHEAFLRAIFDAPDDDTPRLVYADFLQENGEEARAELIRVQCELVAEPWTVADARMAELHAAESRLINKLFPNAGGAFDRPPSHVRGFVGSSLAALEGDDLHDVVALRQRIVRETPHWFGATSLWVRSHPQLDSERIDALFAPNAFSRVTKLELYGIQHSEEAPEGDEISSVYVTHPTIGVPGVVALAQHRGMRRITELDLRHNDLDNDAARALVKSPYLDNLKRLQLLEGNRLRGKVWQQVIERFGEDVLG